MSGRVTSDLLLVGSLPADSTDSAFRSGAEYFGDLVFALPDGETGPRAAWVGYERLQLIEPNPAIAKVRDTESPDGRSRHVYDSPTYTVRDGETLSFPAWPRIDETIASYEAFKALRDAGTIPAGLRFQVGLPFPESAMNMFREDVERSYTLAATAYEDLLARELPRLFDAIPASDLAIQWDLAFETKDIEGVLSWMPEGGWERFAGPVRRLARLVPDEVLIGYHFCHGTFPQWPMYEPQDMSVLVRMSNFAVAESGRPVDWLHLAGPRVLRSEDKRFFRPLSDLDVGGTRVFLGIVQPVDGIPGVKRRYATAKRYLDDFGVAMYCGFGRQPGQDGDETMREHRDTVLSVVGG